MASPTDISVFQQLRIEFGSGVEVGVGVGGVVGIVVGIVVGTTMGESGVDTGFRACPDLNRCGPSRILPESMFQRMGPFGHVGNDRRGSSAIYPIQVDFGSLPVFASNRKPMHPIR
jgi:hypothetical protein